ncbi:UDP-N-acetylmuramoyl-tripeptide--D-alanyl-D-alanine ligase [candidate division KSB1 bacterium]|nr:UDP-N-acetylmuramoyl-tripeptide--D-alanyl-D-alanine ligase [candidate division KSB1 bacterium]
MQLTLYEIMNQCDLNGSWLGETDRLHQKINQVSTDSRSINAGDVFVALKGDRFDGHDYVGQALQKNVLGSVVSRAWQESQPQNDLNNILVVDDPLTALQSMATFYRQKFDIPVLALTGSSGKTTTKEMISAVLSGSFAVHRNIKSFNNHIGVPLTLLGLRKEHHLCVAELGTNHFGELSVLSKLVQPTMILLTNIGYAHLETFGSLHGVLDAKLEILHGTAPDAKVIYRKDDPFLNQVDWHSHPTVSYGLCADADIQGTIIDCDPEGRYRFTCLGKEFSLSIPGRHMVDNALAAIAVAKQFGVKDYREKIESFAAVDQRMQVKEFAGMTVILDYYNANPDSVYAAFQTMSDIEIKGGRRIAILADMLELGELSKTEHEKLAQRAQDNGIDSLFLFGNEMRHTYERARTLGIDVVRYFERKQDLLSATLNYAQAGDLILIKGSRGMKLEDVWHTFTDRT